MKYWILLVLLFPSLAFAQVTAETCQPFYQALESVPHESIFQREGFFNSRWFETTATGCFLVLNTNQTLLGKQTLPDLSGAPGSPFYNDDWRINPVYAADGPGTQVVGLEKGQDLCLVMTEQPSYIDDDGEIIKNIFIKVRVECLKGKQGKQYELMLRQPVLPRE